MIVCNFYFIRIAFMPAKADPPLIVNTNAMLTSSFSRELFQTIRWGNAEVPIIFVVISLISFKIFHYTYPFQTAIEFLCFIIFMDIFIIALWLIVDNDDKFVSLLNFEKY